jgi:hypothetical protein
MLHDKPIFSLNRDFIHLLLKLYFPLVKSLDQHLVVILLVYPICQVAHLVSL